MNPLNNVLLIATGFILGNKSGREMASRALDWANEKSKEILVLEKDKGVKEDAGDTQNITDNRNAAS